IPRVATVTANVPSTNPFFVSPVPGANSARVTWSLFPQYESLMNPYYAWSWNASGGVEFDVVGDTRGTFYYSHGESKEVMNRSRNGINRGALAAAVDDTDPATALTVFGGPNNPATIERLVDNRFVITGATELDVANLQFDRSLLELSGGAMRYA